jgi:6-phosphogluconolactonase
MEAHFAATDPDGRPGLVLLGMGDDGHTASLFPGTTALEERERTYVANWVESKEAWRLTATFPLLWSARRIFFVVTGETKGDMLRRILEGGEPFPAQRVAAGAEDATWFLDAAAASRLTASPL